MAWHGVKTGLSRVCGRPPAKAGPALKIPDKGRRRRETAVAGQKPPNGAPPGVIRFFYLTRQPQAPRPLRFDLGKRNDSGTGGLVAWPGFSAGQNAGREPISPLVGEMSGRTEGGALALTLKTKTPNSTKALPSRSRIPPSVGYADISPTRGEIARTVGVRHHAACRVPGGQ